MAVTIDELNGGAGAVIEEVTRTGQPTVVTDHGRPVAEIFPISENPYKRDGILDLIGGYGALADPDQSGRSAVDELLAERREEEARENLS